MTVTEVFDATYEEAIKEGYVVLDLYGDHCGPCKAMAPYFSQVASEMAYIRFLKSSVDQNRAIKEKYNSRLVPTLLFMKDGEIKERLSAALDDKGLREHIAKLLYD